MISFMGFFIEMTGKGKLDLKSVGEICLDGLAREYSGNGKEFRVISLEPFRTGHTGTSDCYLLGRFETGFDGSVLKEKLDVNAYRLGHVQHIGNRALRFLVDSNKILPDWRIVTTGDEDALSREIGFEVAGELVKLSNVKEAWHYWFDSRGRVDLEPASAVLSNL